MTPKLKKLYAERDKIHREIQEVIRKEAENRKREGLYCKSCGHMKFTPCPDCVDGECQMNCGPAMVDVCGILECATLEYQNINNLQAADGAQKMAMRLVLKLMMERLGLKNSFDKAIKEKETKL